MSGPYAQQVVWITGASSGIGEALALQLARQGAKLVLSARRIDELERVAKACGGDCLVLPLDLTKSETFEAATAQVLARFGRVDVMVHNGGVSQRSWVKDTPMEVHRRLMEVNYFGTVALTRAVLPSMLAAKRGHFVVISSVAGKLGTPKRSSYCASKHALQGFFDCLRAEVTPEGLHVTVITPGYVATNISKNALTADGSATGATSDDIANGLSAEACAAQILDAMRARVSEAFVGKLGKERLALLLKRLLPGVLERMVVNQVPQ